MFSHASHISLIGCRASFLPSLPTGVGGQLNSIDGGVMHRSGLHLVQDCHGEQSKKTTTKGHRTA